MSEIIDTPNLSDFAALVVDDEPLPRLHLVRLLEEAGLGTVRQAPGAAQCLEIMARERERPHWLFLDVRMPGVDGLSLADIIRAAPGAAPAIVFVTGYEDYAVQAFECAAVDYLLKPVRRERLAITLGRLAAAGAPRAADPASAGVLQRLPIRTDYATRLVDIDEIVAAYAHEKKVQVVTRDASYPTYYTLSQLEERLPADRFLRVHDGWIVNLAEVLEIHNLGSQTYQIRLRHHPRPAPVSRRRVHELHRRLGL